MARVKPPQQEGERVRAPRGDSKGEILPPIRIGDHKYACQKCQAGHRVNKCRHTDEPILRTKKTGRPSAKEREEEENRRCECPKNCNCLERDCKCGRNCTCMMTRYLVVFVPFTTSDNEDNYKVVKEVITDRKGKPLDPEEIEKRKRQRDDLQKEKEKVRKIGGLLSTKDSKASDITTPSCCSQRKTPIEDQVNPEVKTHEPYETISQPQCLCGETCKCAFCMTHPNNETSRGIVSTQFKRLTRAARGLPQSVLDQEMTFEAEKYTSCVGSVPSISLRKTPLPFGAEFYRSLGPENPTPPGCFFQYPVSNIWSGTQIDDTFSPSAQSNILDMPASDMHLWPEEQGLLATDLQPAVPQHFDNFFLDEDAFTMGQAQLSFHGPGINHQMGFGPQVVEYTQSETNPVSNPVLNSIASHAGTPTIPDRNHDRKIPLIPTSNVDPNLSLPIFPGTQSSPHLTENKHFSGRSAGTSPGYSTGHISTFPSHEFVNTSASGQPLSPSASGYLKHPALDSRESIEDAANEEAFLSGISAQPEKGFGEFLDFNSVDVLTRDHVPRTDFDWLHHHSQGVTNSQSRQ